MHGEGDSFTKLHTFFQKFWGEIQNLSSGKVPKNPGWWLQTYATICRSGTPLLHSICSRGYPYILLLFIYKVAIETGIPTVLCPNGPKACPISNVYLV